MPRPSSIQSGLFAMPQPARQMKFTDAAASPCPLRVSVLGSGSGGNSTVVSLANRAMLIDAGFGPRTTAKRLAPLGLHMDAIEAICLTHLDQDHFRPHWSNTLLKRRIRLFVHRSHAPQLLLTAGGRDLMQAGLVKTFEDQLEPLPQLRGLTTLVQHDHNGAVGFRFDSTHGCLGYATDLGHVPTALIERFRDVDILCLESNHDPQMTMSSGRPVWLNHRNLSDNGHLSNEQAFAAVCAICAISEPDQPRHVLLMHRSQQCNHPGKMREVFEQHPQVWQRVTLTQQHGSTPWFIAQRSTASPITMRHS